MPALSKEATMLEPLNDFGLSLLRQTPVNDSIILSPVSIALALALVHTGARGQTKDELSKVLGYGKSNEDIAERYSAFSKSLQTASDGIDARAANRIFINTGFNVKDAYLAEIDGRYSAKAETLDFTDSSKAANVVNGFVNETTNGKIQKLMDPSSLRGAVAVLINALYLKADWKSKFNKELTQEGDFYVDEATVKKVMFMRSGNENRLYFENEDCQVLTMPYQDSHHNCSFSIILPKDKTGLSSLRSKLTGSKLNELLENTRKTLVNVKIPKMKVEKELNLVEVLKAIGIEEMFNPSADLSGISDEPLFVSGAKHKALMETDEEGSVAAAATSITMSRSLPAARPRAVEFNADHPFLFAINMNGFLMFVGHFNG